ncbi:MAG: trypsin-like peptidase domain-containing protein [bacterium]|jgi:serine protease Do
MQERIEGSGIPGGGQPQASVAHTRLKPVVRMLFLAAVLAAGTALAWNPARYIVDSAVHPATERTSAPAARMAEASLAVPIPPMPAPNYRAIVERFGPSVVGINVAGTRPVARNPSDPMQQFFRGLPGMPQPRGDAPFRGQGSGFIVSADGLVLTNAHVVRDAKEVTVKLQDRTEHRARVLGIDPATDIAVLRIDAANLPAVVLGDPSQVRVGDYVLAIGAPFGFEQSATQGIVSAKGRALPGDSRVPFIQTDAAVNPGNSGGPLFDGSGRVIGINSQIYSSSGGFQGLAFAIPIDVAMRVKDQIVATGRVDHARLGVVVQDLDQALAESFGLPRPDGAVISAVQPGSAAAAAGLRPGDVVVRVAGQPVNTAAELSQRIGAARPGETLSLQVWRERATREVRVRLQAVAQAESAEVARPSAAPAHRQPG